ncbi:MAG: TRAP transporter small permease [Spirochaetaceae bacterium]|nr:MAG: TRAP transporter small permease [Spirochaetaceae bacterium]
MTIRDLYKKTIIIEESVSTVAFILLFLTVLLQVVFRTPFIIRTVPYAPIWTEELSRWLFVYVVFFGASRGVYARDHIAIDTLVIRFPVRVKAVIDVFVDLVMLIAVVLVIFVAFRGMPFIARQRATTLPFTYRYLYGVIPVSSTLMAVRLVGIIITDVQRMISLAKGAE